MELRERILGLAADLPLHVLYYDRKEDENLPRGAIEQAIADEVVTVDEIVGPLVEALNEARTK